MADDSHPDGADELRQKAETCRLWAANLSPTDPAREALLALAAKYDAQAGEAATREHLPAEE